MTRLEPVCAGPVVPVVVSLLLADRLPGSEVLGLTFFPELDLPVADLLLELDVVFELLLAISFSFAGWALATWLLKEST
jgi:hypothetical protein